MMLEFLNKYSKSISLDEECFNKYFPDGIKKSDFLLFEKLIICEYKEVKNFDIKNRVEKVAKKVEKSEQDIKRDLLNTIEKALSKANKQIKQTKECLKLPLAMGLVVIENKIPGSISVLSLMDAANRKMMSGLDNVEGVLCLDFSNTFTNTNGNHIQPAQIVIRDTKQANYLYKLVGDLLKDFTASRDCELFENFDITKADQIWTTKPCGKYGKYSASLYANYNDASSKKIQK